MNLQERKMPTTIILARRHAHFKVPPLTLVEFLARGRAGALSWDTDDHRNYLIAHELARAPVSLPAWRKQHGTCSIRADWEAWRVWYRAQETLPPPLLPEPEPEPEPLGW